MKRTKMFIFKALFAVLSSCCLASCMGTLVCLPESKPAAFDLRRGATVAIHYKGKTADDITYLLAKYIKVDEYYVLVNNDFPNPAYSIHVESENGAQYRSVYSQIQVGRYGRTIWSDNTDIPYPQMGDNEIDIYERKYAKMLYNQFVPHESKYCIYMDPDKTKNPTLARAVEYADNGKWETAKSLAKISIKEHPDDAEGYFVLGVLLRNDSEFDESDRLIRKALSIKPDEDRYTEALQKNETMRTSERQVINQLQGN